MPIMKYCDVCCKEMPHDRNGNCLECWVKKIKETMNGSKILVGNVEEVVKLRNEIRFRLTIKQGVKSYEYFRFCNNFKELDELLLKIKKEHWDVEQ